ncbi:flagellar hook-associated protein FlgK [Cellulomonas sp. URHD0024]|uniref:flagellar hook-associated protein FlgK n=1 Tax=Cellulomonas sp. URHD0024 TaxID=1302620 RepID=UPI0003FAE76D|nr:flagellar hook-associated protein FlgK [Cellulomonas sp. URHD0024]
MSTFSGLGTALSSLIAQRQGLDVAGQNVANANTVGYTRQRATTAALPSSNVASMFATNDGPGQGVRVTGIDRLADVFLDARVRTQTSGASFLKARADAYATLEGSIGEPGKDGLANQLSTMWSAWGDVANTPDKDSARAVLLNQANAVVDRIATLYQAADTQWTQARSTTVALVDQVNTTAASVADLNGRILDITNSGGSAAELMDQRDQLITQLSSTVGASIALQPNGQMNVLVGGNPLVSGVHAHPLAVTGAQTFAAATGTTVPPVAGVAVEVEWAEHPGRSAALDGGRVAGLISVLAPPDATTHTGGILTEAAARYDELATTLHDQVNAAHVAAYTIPTPPATVGSTGNEFFTFDPTRPAALGLSVAITDPSLVAVATQTGGALDGSVGASIADLANSTSGPNALWSKSVVEIGSRTASAASRAAVAESSRATAEAGQLSQASVDTDEETVSMLAYQRAYEGAARVLTAIDSMLDTLINRTGLVGR